MSNKFRHCQRLAPVLLIAIFVGACATKPPASDPVALAEYERENDPFKPLNKATWKFNVAVDKAILRPLAIGYRTVIPGFLRQMITNVFQNADMPLVFVHELLQGEPKRAGITAGRFLTNTTVGIGGLLDPATEWGLERHDEDFGQTLAVWGVGPGPFVMLPFLGPSNVRDAFGFAVDRFADPVDIAIDHADVKGLQLGLTAGEVFDIRQRNFDVIEEVYASPDTYTTARSVYRQNRAFDISNGAITESEEEEEFFDEDFEDEDFEDESSTEAR